MITIIMTVGLPGSGKTTWSRTYAAEHGMQVHSSDDVRKCLYGDETILGDSKEVFSELYKEVDDDIKKGIGSIIDSTALLPRHRDIIRKYREMGCHTVAAVFDLPFEVCMERNGSRERVVPEYAMERMRTEFTEPSEEEGFDDVWHICG